MCSTPSATRWAGRVSGAQLVGSLVFGVAGGLALGFALGLARPRANQQDTGPMGTGQSGADHPGAG